MKKIEVLGYGHVMLVDHMGDDLAVSQSARLSYDEAWRAGEDEKSDTKLINYLWSHHHTTPFESVTFKFDIKAPIFVLRQWHRHRTQSYNELSARYRELPEEYYVPKPEDIGQQSKSSKQARDITEAMSQDDLMQRRAECDSVENHIMKAFSLYRHLLSTGWPRELARSVLPVATFSHMQTTLNLLNLMKFLTLRCDAHAQYEIRVYANAMRDLAREIVPVCIATWENNLPKHFK